MKYMYICAYTFYWTIKRSSKNSVQESTHLLGLQYKLALPAQKLIIGFRLPWITFEFEACLGYNSKFKASLSYTVRAYSSSVTCFSGMCKYLGCNFQYYRRKGKEGPTMSAYALYPVLGKYRQVNLSSRLGDIWKRGGGSTNFGQKKTYFLNPTNL